MEIIERRWPAVIQHHWPAPLSAVHSARIIFADPPYNQGVRYADDDTGDRMSEDQYRGWCESVLDELYHLMTPGATLWWMCPERHADHMGPALEKRIGPRVYRIIFEESFAQYQQGTLTDDYRMIFCHRREGGQLVFNPDSIREMSIRQEMGDKRADPRGRVPGRVWKVRRLQGTSKDRVDWHPTQLAPELLRRIVRGWSNRGDLVVDAFAGSGNMGLVCTQEGRDFVGIDGSPTYVQKIQERLRTEAPSAAA